MAPTSEEAIATRLANARHEFGPDWYPYWIVNDDRDLARRDLIAMFSQEELRRERWSAPPIGG